MFSIGTMFKAKFDALRTTTIIQIPKPPRSTQDTRRPCPYIIMRRTQHALILQCEGHDRSLKFKQIMVYLKGILTPTGPLRLVWPCSTHSAEGGPRAKTAIRNILCNAGAIFMFSAGSMFKATGGAHIIVPGLIIVPVDRMGPGGPYNCSGGPLTHIIVPGDPWGHEAHGNQGARGPIGPIGPMGWYVFALGGINHTLGLWRTTTNNR